MLIREIIKEKQPKVYEKIKKDFMQKVTEVTFEECENLMKHSSYKRYKGALRQVR